MQRSGCITLLIPFIMFQAFYRLGSALMALKQYDRALDILKNGLHTAGAQEQKYEIFKKIMTLVFSTEGLF